MVEVLPSLPEYVSNRLLLPLEVKTKQNSNNKKTIKNNNNNKTLLFHKGAF